MREKEWWCQKLKTSNLERQGGISRVREWKKICRNSLEGEISSWRWTLLHKGRSILWESRSEVKGQRDSEGEGVRGINCSFKNLEIMKKNKKNSWKEKKKIICFSEKMERSKGAWEQLKDGMNEVEKWREEPFLRLREQTNGGQPV